MKKLLLLLSIFVLTACGPNEADFKTDVPVATKEVIEENKKEVRKTKRLPKSVNLDVTFFPQAPDGDWSLPWQETCEEASIVQAYYFIKDKPLNRDDFRQQLLELVEWQNERFGYFEDTTTEETAVMLSEFYNHHNLEIIDNPTLEDIRYHLAQGHPIVAPFAGRLLGNPFFSGQGPYYHMATIVGYDEDHLIVNDVGTRRGDHFVYENEVIMNAIHDWNPEGVLDGKKTILIVKP